MFEFEIWDFIGSVSLLFTLSILMSLSNSPIQPKRRQGRPKPTVKDERIRITSAMIAVCIGYLAMKLAQ